MTFFEKYTYKQKNLALLVLGALLIAAAYKRSFKTTLETLTYKEELVEKIAYAQQAGSTIKSLQQQLTSLNRLIGKENVTVEKVQQGFLNFFASRAQNLSVYQIDEVLTYKHPDFTIITHRIVLKGGFNQTLTFIYDLEKNFELAKVLNVTFEYRKNNPDEPAGLYTELLLQNYER